MIMEKKDKMYVFLDGWDLISFHICILTTKPFTLNEMMCECIINDYFCLYATLDC